MNNQQQKTAPLFIFCGIKHCGKSTLGRRVAEARGWTFHDLDDLIDCSPYESVRELYRHGGAPLFQERETAALKHYLKNPPDGRPGHILSLGGGTLENETAWHHLRHSSRSFTIIYLAHQPEVLFQRIERKGLPPFLEGADPKTAFMELYHRRDRVFSSRAHRRINLFDAPVERTRQQLDHFIETLL